MAVDGKEVSLLLTKGTRDNLDVAFKAAKLVNELVAPKSAVKIFGLKDCFILGGGVKLEGKDIAAHLQNCAQIALMAATVGKALDDEIERLKACDLPLAYALDTAASLAVEEVCDNVEDTLRRDAINCGKGVTPRFSCGYGDFPLEIQPKLLDLLKASKTTGIILTDGLLMYPSKSVTAVMGIGEGVLSHKRECVECRYNGVCQHKLCAFKKS